MGQPGEDYLEDALREILDALPSLDPEHLFQLAQLWSEEDQRARRDAWQRAKVALDADDRADLLEQAREDVGSWMRTTQADFHGISGILGREDDQASLRRNAAPAVLDAACGLLAEVDLQAADYDVLSRPWRLTIDSGEPEPS